GRHRGAAAALRPPALPRVGRAAQGWPFPRGRLKPARTSPREPAAERGFRPQRCRVSKASAPQPLNLQLWFGDVLVADLLNLFPHQGTWFAQYRQVVAPEQGPVQARLREFIRFCEAWHQRLAGGENPNAKEFDQYADVIESASWRVPCPDGTDLRMAGGPIFVQ